MGQLARAIGWVAFIACLPWLGATWVLGRISTARRVRAGLPPRLVWVGVPVNSHADVSRVMARAGFSSWSVATERYPNSDLQRYDDWVPTARRLPKGLNALVEQVRAYVFFGRALLTVDVMHGFFDGGFLRRTPLRDVEYAIWRRAGKRLVLMPYGRDSFVYADMPPDRQVLAHLKAVYPNTPEEDAAIRDRLARFTALADVVVGAVGHTACLPRVDVWPVVWYPGNTSLAPVYPATSGPVRIAHSTNHRPVKGTDQLIAAVDHLRRKGHDITLDILEKVPNAVVLERIATADIVVDQLFEGYALAAIEALTLGKVVVSALDYEPTHARFRRFSYLDRCPIVSANIHTIEAVLEDLIARRAEWPAIGRRSRQYAQEFHSPEASERLFRAVYDRIWYGRDVDLLALYAPQPVTAQAT